MSGIDHLGTDITLTSY